MEITEQDKQYGVALSELWTRRSWSYNPRLPGGYASAARFPDFLIIGAQKSGTTWLHVNLSYHPEIWCSPLKELNHFNEIFMPSPDGWEKQSRKAQLIEAKNFLSGLSPNDEINIKRLESLDVVAASEFHPDWYERHFSFAGLDQLCGESTVDYCTLPRRAITHIVSRNPSVKVLFLMRDPIQRSWSQMRMMKNLQYPDMSMEQLVLEKKCPDFSAQSNYPSMLSRWGSILSKDNFKALTLDEITRSPELILAEVCEFLGIAFDIRFFPKFREHIFVGSLHALTPQIHEYLRTALKPIYDELYNVLPKVAAPWIALHYG